MPCELCDQPGGEIVWRDERLRVVLVDGAEYPGFCRVIWNRHLTEMTDLAPADRDHFMAVVFGVESVLRTWLSPDKINLASLGNQTPHLHWHVIPRWRGDRHFPQPIWGTPQRLATHSADLGDKLAQLPTKLAKALCTLRVD